MDYVLDKVFEYIKRFVIPYIMKLLGGMFDSVNSEVGSIASDVAMSPSAFSPSVFNMIRNISETVIMPIAGMILAFVAVYELVQLVTSYNNLANFETWFIFKWIFKTAIAVELITHTFDFTMAVFDVSQHVVMEAEGIIGASTSVDASALAGMEPVLQGMDFFELIALCFQILIISTVTQILSKLIFVIIYVRLIEIYMYVSLAPIPFATWGNKEHSAMGMHFVKSLFALGLQGFLIMICVGIYAMLIASLSFSNDIVGSLWGVLGFTLLLAFSLFKTNTVAKAILQCQ